MRTFTIPNIITVLRIIAVPLFIIFFKTDPGIATWIFVIAILTDVLDGIVARVRKSRSVLGSILDPLADKILVDTAFLLLAFKDLIPYWMAVTVISKDFIVILGWIIIFIITSNIKVKPSIYGKLTNFLQSSSVILLLVFGANQGLTLYLDIYLYLTIGMTVISLLDYIVKGIKRLG